MGNDADRRDGAAGGRGTADPTGETAPLPLSADRLCRRCDPASFTFDKVEELADPPLLFGQERAISAI